MVLANLKKMMKIKIEANIASIFYTNFGNNLIFFAQGKNIIKGELI